MRDITYCSGLRCGKEKTCERWTGHLVAWYKSQDGQISHTLVGLFPTQVSVAEFADHDGKCEHHIPLGDADKKEREYSEP